MIDKNTEDLINIFLQVRSELYSEVPIKENKEMQKLISCSILNSIILSKKIFKRNYMITKFLELYFSISFSKYVFTSRTMICGKITKYIYDIDDNDELINLLNSIYNILTKIKDNRDVFDADIYDVIMGIKL